MTGLTIRAPNDDDLEALTDLHFYMWNEFYKDYVPAVYSQKWYTRPQCQAIQEEMLRNCRDNPKEHFSRVVMVDDTLAAIGYINRPTEDEDDLLVPGFDTEFQRLYLWPQFRGRNIGSQMMKLGMEWLEKNSYRSTYLWAFDQNPYGRFYPKHGAEIVKQMSRDYEGTPLALTAYGWRL